MLKRAWLMVSLANLPACGGSDGSHSETDASVQDAGYASGDAGSLSATAQDAGHVDADGGSSNDTAQDAAHACENDGGYAMLCKDAVQPQTVQLPCFYSVAQLPSAGLDLTCLVSPDGTLYLLLLRGDLNVATPGWTIDGRGGERPGTLSAQDQARCEAAKSANAANEQDAGGGACWLP